MIGRHREHIVEPVDLPGRLLVEQVADRAACQMTPWRTSRCFCTATKESRLFCKETSALIGPCNLSTVD
jgi:hypothetical protein